MSFDSAGVWMTTDHVGPLVAGRDEDKQSARIAPARAPEELRRSLLLEPRLLLGRPLRRRARRTFRASRGASLFLAAGPREREGWLALAAVVTAWLGTLLLIPDNWYGGAGTIGNRYLLSFLPLGLLLAAAGPRGGRGRDARRS